MRHLELEIPLKTVFISTRINTLSNRILRLPRVEVKGLPTINISLNIDN